MFTHFLFALAISYISKSKMEEYRNKQPIYWTFLQQITPSPNNLSVEIHEWTAKLNPVYENVMSIGAFKQNKYIDVMSTMPWHISVALLSFQFCRALQL